MDIQLLRENFTVCQINDINLVDLDNDFVFLAKTDEEISLVCPSDLAPAQSLAAEEGWRGLKICGPMDFSMIGIISRLTSVLAAEDIPVFVISTFDTDYIFVKDEDLSKALYVLEDEYRIEITETY